jgi:hypothetical protein
MALRLLVLTGTILALAGCASARQSTPVTVSTSPSSPPAATAPSTSTAPESTSTASADALQAEATSAATGDVPDNQVFLVFTNRAAGYSMKYPEGWAQQGKGDRVTFHDKNNIVRVVVTPAGSAPTLDQVKQELAGLQGATVKSGPEKVTVSGAPAFKVVYTTESAPSPVTGKKVTLQVDRYYLWHGGKEAIVDLGTPQGVDNVDAFRLMIESFRWK